MSYLSQHYPSLYVQILTHMNMQDKIDLYMSKCKEFENDAEKYSLYIHGYLMVYLDK